MVFLFLCLFRTWSPLGKHYDQRFSFQTQSSGSTTGQPVREIHHGFYQTTQETWQRKQYIQKKRKEIRQLGNIPWKVSFASNDFLSEVFGFCKLYFFSVWLVLRKNKQPLLPPSSKSQSSWQKKTDWTIPSRGAQKLAKCISLSFRWTTGRRSAHCQRHPGVSLNQFEAPAALHTFSLFRQELAAAGLMNLALWAFSASDR